MRVLSCIPIKINLKIRKTKFLEEKKIKYNVLVVKKLPTSCIWSNLDIMVRSHLSTCADCVSQVSFIGRFTHNSSKFDADCDNGLVFIVHSHFSTQLRRRNALRSVCHPPKITFNKIYSIQGMNLTSNCKNSMFFDCLFHNFS